MQIKLMDKVLSANDAWAQDNRSWLKERGILMFNIIGSPGAGKTSLLERTIRCLREKVRIAVIEGDIATTRDAQRIEKAGAAAFQINTGNACHLDANLVSAALKELVRDASPDLIFVENIGNLVCPAEFDIGEAGKIAVLSVTEGDDKVEKYPLLFSEAEVLVVSKIALLPATNFDLPAARQDFKRLNDRADVIALDSVTGEGFDRWLQFIEGKLAQQKALAASLASAGR